MKKSTKNILIVASTIIVFLIVAFTLLPSETHVLNLSENNTVGTVITGNTFTVNLQFSNVPALYDHKWDLVKKPDNSRLLSWDYIINSRSLTNVAGSCTFTFEALYPGTENITFVYWESYEHNIQKEVTITVTTIE